APCWRWPASSWAWRGGGGGAPAPGPPPAPPPGGSPPPPGRAAPRAAPPAGPGAGPRGRARAEGHPAGARPAPRRRGAAGRGGPVRRGGAGAPLARGVDPTGGGAVRDYLVVRGAALAGARGLLLEAGFAARRGCAVGRPVRLVTPRGPVEVEVAGLLAGGW